MGPSQRKSQIALIGAVVITLMIVGAWAATLGDRLTHQSGTLSASNEAQGSDNSLSMSGSIQEQLGRLGDNFTTLQDSVKLLSGSGETQTQVSGAETMVPADTQEGSANASMQ